VSGRLLAVSVGLACWVAAAASTAHAQANVVFGITDDTARWTWPAFGLQIASLQPIHVGLALKTDCRGSVPPLGIVPPTQPLKVTLLGPGTNDSACLSDSGVAAYARVARMLALENPNIREIQVWNEEDLCWWPCYGAERKPRFQGWFLDKYLDLLAATHDALAGTGVMVLGFGMSPRINDKWSPEALAAGVVGWYASRGWSRPIMDGFAWHPYCNYQTRITNQIVTAFDNVLAPRDDWGSRDRAPVSQPSFSRGLKIWWTETGLDTGAVAGNHGYTGVESGISACAHGSEKDQARRIRQIALLARSDPHVAADFNFLLNDEPNLKFWQTGLYRPDGTAKPALGAFRRAVR
jgi:hypothetical protein